MSYQNFDQFQNPGNGEGASAPGAPTPQDTQMSGQQSEQSQGQFPGAPTGEVTTPGGGPAGDQKTTLW